MLARARRGLALLLAVAVSAPFARVRADVSPADKQLATDLFDKAVKKMESGRCDQTPIGDREACLEARDLFRRAYEVYPAGLGALRNLAYVELGLGLLASAARSFRDLERKAPDDPNPKRHVWAEYARKELDALEPRVPHLTLVVAKDAPAMTITLDGVAIPQAAWGTALDVDPGKHVVHAEASGCPPFDASIDLVEKDDRKLDVAPCAAKEQVPPTSKDGGSRIAPLVFAGMGAASLGVGLVFGVVAIVRKNDACGDSNLCDPQGLEDARTAARTSNVLTGAGAALLVGGLAWYVLTPAPKAEGHATRVSPWAGPGAIGLSASGSF